MSTVKLNCANCTIEFEKDKHEVSRRKAKGPSSNFFCSRSCNASYRNRNNPQNGEHLKSTAGNQFRRIYTKESSWYMHRMISDSRKGRCRFVGDPLEMQAHIENIWTGRCVITNSPIERRLYKQTTTTKDPFKIASIDRIDNDKPYETGNIQWTCLAINKARGNIPLTEFMSYYKDLVLDQ